MVNPSEDIKRELQATLAARREIGPGYDEHFLEALVEKITIQAKQNTSEVQPHKQNADADQRLGLAICSLIFGIPLIAIANSSSLVALILVCLTILGINFSFNMRH
jgi:hypothetical protein